MQLVCITVWPKNHKCENQKSLTRVSLNSRKNNSKSFDWIALKCNTQYEQLWPWRLTINNLWRGLEIRMSQRRCSTQKCFQFIETHSEFYIFLSIKFFRYSNMKALRKHLARLVPYVSACDDPHWGKRGSLSLHEMIIITWNGARVIWRSW